MSDPAPSAEALAHHTIIVGFGLPGRHLAEYLAAQAKPFVVIEKNEITVRRCTLAGVPILTGNAGDSDVLTRAGIATASLVAIMLPDDATVLAVITQVRQINPTVRIIARCNYTSSGLEARSRGANEVVVAEQAVARELVSLLAETTSKD